jgi:hypothetical protein
MNEVEAEADTTDADAEQRRIVAEQMSLMMNSPMMQSLMDNPTMMRQVLQMSIESYPQLQQMINSLATYSTTVRYYLYCHSMTLCVWVGVCVGVYFLYVPFCTHSSLLSLYLFVFTCIHSIVDSRSGSE